MSDTTTSGIRIQVKPQFWKERSDPANLQWAFAYTVIISNLGSAPAKLRMRHWVITDGTGHIEEVRGPGVIGKEPRLQPGESFEYTSWAMLKTPLGTMRGEYLFERDDKTGFEALIGEFVLAERSQLH